MIEFGKRAGPPLRWAAASHCAAVSLRNWTSKQPLEDFGASGKTASPRQLANIAFNASETFRLDHPIDIVQHDTDDCGRKRTSGKNGLAISRVIKTATKSTQFHSHLVFWGLTPYSGCPRPRESIATTRRSRGRLASVRLVRARPGRPTTGWNMIDKP
jgi:hypothetical protein